MNKPMYSLRQSAVVIVHHGTPSVTERAALLLRRAYPPAVLPHVFIVENGQPGVALPDSVGITRHRRSTNGGYGAGANVGLQAALRAGADFVVVLNHDVEPRAGFLEALRRAWGGKREVGLVGLPLVETEGSVAGGGTIAWWRPRARLARHPALPSDLGYLHGACLGVTRRCLETVGLFREDLFLYWEDVEYSVRVRRAGFRFALASGPPLRHLRRAPAGAGNRDATYYLVRNALLVTGDLAPPRARAAARILRSLRYRAATIWGEPQVARALADAASGRTGPAPAPRATHP